jgi:energy-coupling factor transporter transmembrane protein EcfT
MSANNRDFIDFLISLFRRKKIFFLILLFILAYTTYFVKFINDTYSFKTSLKIAPKSVVLPIINSLNLYSAAGDQEKTKQSSNLETYRTMELGLCEIIYASFVDRNFYLKLADDYNAKNPYAKEDRNGLSDIFSNIISTSQHVPSVCALALNKGAFKYINYLYQNYPTMLNNYIENEIATHLSLLRSTRIDYLQKSLESIGLSIIDISREEFLQKLELNVLEERRFVIESNIELIKIIETPTTKISYFMHQSNKPSKTLNFIFLYIFALFLSIIFFVLTVVLIEFKEQYKLRNTKEN